ncbi:hypothetical protein HPC49_47450 [Pyxidicoccus fallax]|uniref:Uncharacterized protein n=1 Tax=Pyxidicoccus fallax TaxID=394095 RepID=A0A848LZ03_9BACT|nr:hypothetical protein [Pyxidicoccus fallax]NMO23076.1 hypothetical protein [Pyxidicoccus fallax]NPC85814.1 hypothetical protein [Pyxidicoccus fallax]
MACGTLPRLWPPPTQAEVDAIIRMEDPVLRNLHITQAYHVLKVALTDVFGEEDVNWCGFSTWASKTAGAFIRKDVLPGLLGELLDKADAVTRSLTELQDTLLGAWGASVGVQFVLARTLEEITDEVARNAARGNFIVFEELGPLYTDILETFSGMETPDTSRLERVLSRLSPGPLEEGGQDLLIRATRAYFEAMFTTDRKARAELMFLGNALVGYHEQARLQGPVVAALNAPLRELFLDNLVEFTRADPNRRVRGTPEWGLRGAFTPLANRLERIWRELATRTLMRIELPDVTLRLGEDIPALTSERDFPPELARLEHPDLVALMAELDRTPDDTAGSAARDWGSLADRMNLIVDLFRTRQQDRLLYDQPFTFLQVDAFKSGRVPHGRL